MWSDEFWLFLMQLYLRKPVGMKPLYSRDMVALSLELHIPPQYLYEQMFMLRRTDTPLMRCLWERYGNNPKRLAKGVRTLRQMSGFRNAGEFYAGVEVRESFEKDFRPIPDGGGMTPVMLVMILDLYFRLTPATMVEETPEVQELARTVRVKAGMIVDVLEIFQICDPYLNRGDMVVSPLLDACRQVWQRYGNDNPERLSAFAAQLRAFFES